MSLHFMAGVTNRATRFCRMLFDRCIFPSAQGGQETFLYAAQFSNAADRGRYIAAGGSGANEAKVTTAGGEG